ncbi:ribonuclease H-like domain-containing protein [Tanacetum coccineum]|uniref:Ribonuclease H-like domain-containing protein n=1 Tax=Tanacetum coccineum TaxID=301880 RepID=A0ABQ5IV69_9ASTR
MHKLNIYYLTRVIFILPRYGTNALSKFSPDSELGLLVVGDRMGLNVENTSDVDHLQFFDSEFPQSPNDDGKDSSVGDGSLQHSDGQDSTQSRRSERQTKVSVRLNDYVLNSNVKYGIKKYVNYSKLSTANLCFATNLNKSVEPTCLSEAMSDPNWPLYQLDVNNAFLYGDLNEDVYMTLPDGYNDENKSKVCRLNKSLYSLKQAPRQWNAKLTTALAEHGFKQSKFDYSLYTKHNGDKFIALLVYVDDIITGNDDIGIKEFKVFLNTKFMIEDLGVLKYFLGIEVVENDLGLCMSQRKYCLELLHEYGLLAAKPVDIPFPKNTILSFEETINDKYLFDFTTYQKLVGKLIYITNTRPDISYVVHCLSQHIHSPLQSHFKATLRVLRYLKGSLGCGIQFYKNFDLKIKAYADADWAKCPKTKSSSKAEYRSMSSTSCEVIWLGDLVGKDTGRKRHVQRWKRGVQAHQPEGGC